MTRVGLTSFLRTGERRHRIRVYSGGPARLVGTRRAPVRCDDAIPRPIAGVAGERTGPDLERMRAENAAAGPHARDRLRGRAEMPCIGGPRRGGTP